MITHDICAPSRALRVTMIALIAVGWITAGSAGTASAPTCSTTKPTGHVQGTYQCPGDFGSGGLLVTLQAEIEFRRGGPGYILSDGSYAWKFAWCRKVKGKLSIRGRRLDGSAPPLRSQIGPDDGNPGFVPTDIIFPTVGCWEITGTAGGSSVTFVTHLVDHRDRK